MPDNPPHLEDTTRHDTRLFAVFHDEAAADRASAALVERGITAERADAHEVRDELRAEMKEETEGLALGPGLPAHTKEMLVGAVPFTAAMSVLGAVLFSGLAFLITIPNVGFGQRVIWFAVIGAVTFATGAWFVGGIVGSRMSNTIPAAQRGVTLVVHDGSQATADLLAGHDPIRVDRHDPDGDTTTVLTEDQLHEDLLARRAGAQLTGTDRADD